MWKYPCFFFSNGYSLNNCKTRFTLQKLYADTDERIELWGGGGSDPSFLAPSPLLIHWTVLHHLYLFRCGLGSVVGIVIGYGLVGLGIESWWGRDFPRLSRPALGPTQPPLQWVPSLSRGVKGGRGMTLTPHLLLVPWSRKGRAIPLLPLWAVQPVQSLSACTRVHFTLPLPLFIPSAYLHLV